MRRLGAIAASIAALLAGCFQQTAPLVVTPPAGGAPEDAIIVRGNHPWTDSGIEIAAGESMTIVARGRLRIGRIVKPKNDIETDVGPAGTFFYGDDEVEHDFPLPAAGKGPAPCYCLIAKIGYGPAFYVGEGWSAIARQSGRLWLGINDYDLSENQGEFYVQVHRGDSVQPISWRDDVPLDAPEEPPESTGQVVVIYIDGLRPDVVEEMAAMGHIPHIRQRFVEGGVHLSNAFTAFPSDTITSNGTMWTGCYSDRHGLKGQVRFSRQRLRADSFLEPMGPNRSSKQLGAQGIDKVVQETEAVSVSAIKGSDQGKQWRTTQTSGTPAIYDYLRAQGGDWATGVLPVMTDVPPVLWTRSMTRFLPYFDAHEAWRYIDDANAHFAVRHLLRQQRPVTIIWLPETDSVSHKECRGQFGSTRRTIARADRLVGEITTELDSQGRLDSTYLILVSDHGHVGGATRHLTRFDLTNELFYEPRQVSPDGIWLGGGLGLSVRQYRFENRHTDDDGRQFVFIDGDSDGTARLFLPKGHYKSGDWSGPNRAANLLAYRIGARIAPLNLPETVAATRARHDDGTEQFPVDLVLIKLTDDSILITTADRGQAVIDRRRNDAGQWIYRYTPVENVAPTTEGQVVYQPIDQPAIDPLGLVGRVRKGFLRGHYDEQTWLWLTAGSEYPDGVVALTRHILWQDNIRAQEQEYAPDLVVTARHGWLFGTHNTPGTTHGYPLAESMHATWYVSGPHVRRGAMVETPCRLVDLTPTILEMTGTPYDPDRLDGRAVRAIYDSGTPQVAANRRPVFWNDVDLHAWQPLEYSPAPAYANQPRSINDASNPWDLNNIAYDAVAISDWNILRLMDDALSELVPRRTRLTETVESADAKARHNKQKWVAQGVGALNVSGVAVADYSFTSQGNLKRADETVNWLQARGERLDQKMAKPIGRTSVIGAPVANSAIDALQGSFWEVYRFAQRVLVEVLDETILNGIEDHVDSTINAYRATPAETIVPE